MVFPSEQYRALLKALLSAFSRDSLERMVRLELGESLSHFTSSGPLEQTVFELIAWAERNGCVDSLVTGALAANPGNPELRAVATHFPLSSSSPLQDSYPDLQHALYAMTADNTPAFRRHTALLLDRLDSLALLLPATGRLTEEERAVLLAAAYLYLPLAATPLAERAAQQDQIAQLLDTHLPAAPAGARRTKPMILAADVAWVCRMALDPGPDRSAVRTTTEHGDVLLRTGLLAALLGLVHLLAVAEVGPAVLAPAPASSPQAEEHQLLAQLHPYLTGITLNHGHIRFHYRLPPSLEGPWLPILLSGPAHMYLRRTRDVLIDNDLALSLDGAAVCDPTLASPPDGLVCDLRTIARHRLNELANVLGAGGAAADPQQVYLFSALRRAPSWSWPAYAGADYYECRLVDVDSRQQLGAWSTCELNFTLPEATVPPARRCEWLVYAHAGKHRSPPLCAGIFWLAAPVAMARLDRQLAWYAQLPQNEAVHLRAQVSAAYGLYQEAAALYMQLIDQAPGSHADQAALDLSALYDRIALELGRLQRLEAATPYRHASVQLIKSFRAQVYMQGDLKTE